MTTIFSGLSAGALYALAGVLLTIPLVRCGLINFAQTFYIVLGQYIILDLDPSGWGFLPVMAALLALGGVLGGLQEYLTVRPTHGRHDAALITTVGVAVVIEGFILARWGPDPASFAFFGGSEAVHLFGGVLLPVDLWLIGLAVAAIVVLQYAVQRTRWGILGRAAMTDPTASMLRGVNIPRLRTMAFVLAGACSCALAIFIGPKTGVSVHTTLHLVVFAFAAVAIGGFGSFIGTLIGGVLIGMVEALSARYLNVNWSALLVFAVLCVTLLVRPTGLFGRRQLRLV